MVHQIMFKIQVDWQVLVQGSVRQQSDWLLRRVDGFIYTAARGVKRIQCEVMKSHYFLPSDQIFPVSFQSSGKFLSYHCLHFMLNWCLSVLFILD